MRDPNLTSAEINQAVYTAEIEALSTTEREEFQFLLTRFMNQLAKEDK